MMIQMKNEKQGAAEWLRGIVGESYRKDSYPSCAGIVREFDFECLDMPSHGVCILTMLTTIADRIDAERALPEGIEWPRFEDGELVKIGDEVERGGKAWKVDAICFDREEWSMALSRNLDISRMSGSYGERFTRSTPKVLDADGVEIKVGDTVYCDGEDGALTVTSISGVGVEYCSVTVKNADSSHCTVDAPRLSHERPDSWRAWGDDLDLAVKAGEVDKVEMMRRAKALSKGGQR